jgi:hypothetical protein
VKSTSAFRALVTLSTMGIALALIASTPLLAEKAARDAAARATAAPGPLESTVPAARSTPPSDVGRVTVETTEDCTSSCKGLASTQCGCAGCAITCPAGQAAVCRPWMCSGAACIADAQCTCKKSD